MRDKDTAHPTNELETLRTLLFGPEQQQLHRLEDHVREVDRKTNLVVSISAEDVSRVLPQAVSLRKDDRLAQALSPTIEDALHESVRRKPEALVNAISPILGPAIRKSINDALAALVERIEALGNAAFSVQGLKWRFEAWRTGQPYGDVALTHSLIYQVRELFLIHRESGLLLVHVHQPSPESHDGNTMAAMLTAISDFGADSFADGSSGELREFRFGQLRVVVEAGEKAVLAATVRGIPPPGLREPLARLLKIAHEEMDSELVRFSEVGESDPFEVLRPPLERLLLEERRPRQRNRLAVVLVVLGLVLLMFFIAVSWWSARERRRAFLGFLADLDRSEGIVVTRTSERDDIREIYGLRDPFSESPDAILRRSDVDPETVRMHWQPYNAHRPEWIARRLAAACPPTPGARVLARDGRVTLEGLTTAAWIERARPLALALGAQGIDLTRIGTPLTEDPPWFRTLDQTRGRLTGSTTVGGLDEASKDRLVAIKAAITATDRTLPEGFRQVITLRCGSATSAQDLAAHVRTILDSKQLAATSFETVVDPSHTEELSVALLATITLPDGPNP